MVTKNETTIPLERLIDETVSFFHVLQAVAAHLHQDVGVTSSERGVLKGLGVEGPQTVPQMARSRLVSRQFIQSIVNQLEGKGLVQANPNPAHKRSGLISLTPKGRATIGAIMNKESNFIEAISAGFDPLDLDDAATVLVVLEQRMRQLLQKIPSKGDISSC